MDETIYGLNEAAEKLPLSWEVSERTLARWCRDGIGGEKLKCFRFGRRVGVRLSDVIEFGERVARAKKGDNIEHH